MLEAMLLKLHSKLTSGWVLIQVNFHRIQEIGPKVGGGRSFVSGPSSRDYGTLFCKTTVHSEEIRDSNFLNYLSVEAPHYNLVSFTSQANCM